jgi:mRNA interferase HigB
MNIYNRSSLIAFYSKHPDCKNTLERWYHDVGSKKWRKPGDVTADFNTARAINNSRAIFNINNNDYRLIVEINYAKGWVFIKFIATHAQYDKVDPATVNLFGPATKAKKLTRKKTRKQ